LSGSADLFHNQAGAVLPRCEADLPGRLFAGDVVSEARTSYRPTMDGRGETEFDAEFQSEREHAFVCNLYSMTKNQDAMRQLFRVRHDRTGNLPPLPGIFPDNMAPIVRRGPDGERELVIARWGMPTPPRFLTGPIDRGVTNIRNVGSAHWRAWMKPEFRCLVPAGSFCEPTDAPDPATGRKTWTWFALGEDRPLFAFAGIWCTWRGARGTQKNPVDGEHTLYGFLTTSPNDVVRPVHSKAMPVILTEPAEFDAWLEGDTESALKLQRPLPAERLSIVAKGERQDNVVAA
jgi:putative SOS response-associated peptidase YedK